MPRHRRVAFDDASSGVVTGLYLPDSPEEFGRNLIPVLPCADGYTKGGVDFDENPLLFTIIFVLSVLNLMLLPLWHKAKLEPSDPCARSDVGVDG